MSVGSARAPAPLPGGGSPPHLRVVSDQGFDTRLMDKYATSLKASRLSNAGIIAFALMTVIRAFYESHLVPAATEAELQAAQQAIQNISEVTLRKCQDAFTGGIREVSREEGDRLCRAIKRRWTAYDFTSSRLLKLECMETPLTGAGTVDVPRLLERIYKILR